MRSIAILFAVGMLLFAVPALAQEEGETSFRMTTHGGAAGWFEVDGLTGNNPTLVVPASTEITIELVNEDGMPHNVRIGDDGPVSETITVDGQMTTFTFTSPASGSVTYFCEFHKGTMSGTLRVAGSDAPPADEPNTTPGVGVLGGALALLGAAMLVSRTRRE